MNRPVSAMMQRRVWSAGIDDSVASVEQLLAAHDLSWVPVKDDERGVIGVISANDLLQFHAGGRDAATVRAWQVCTFKPLVVAPDDDAVDVARRMVEHRVHHAVVMDGTTVRGVLSSLDYLRAYIDAARN